MSRYSRELKVRDTISLGTTYRSVQQYFGEQRVCVAISWKTTGPCHTIEGNNMPVSQYNDGLHVLVTISWGTTGPCHNIIGELQVRVTISWGNYRPVSKCPRELKVTVSWGTTGPCHNTTTTTDPCLVINILENFRCVTQYYAELQVLVTIIW